MLPPYGRQLGWCIGTTPAHPWHPPHPTPILTLLSLSKPRGNQRSLVNKQGHKGHSRIKFNRPRRERNKKK